jgi:hypothetical protein
MSFPLGKEQVKEMTSVFLPKKMRPCVKEMQIKTMLSFYLTPVKMARVKTQTTNVSKDVEKKTLHTLLVCM